MPARAGNEPRFLFELHGLPDLQVLRLDGQEGISRLYAFELELVSADRAIDFDQVINRAARLAILGPRAVRFVHGVVLRFEQAAITPRRALYRARLEPPHGRLAYQRRLRIFQDLSTVQIVTRVLEEGGIKGLEWKLKAKYPPRNYCVQYRETDLGFITRLLEEEGIAFHFEHTEKELRTVFCDDRAARQPIAGPPAVIFNADRSMVPTQERVSHFTCGQGFGVTRVELRDYSFRAPRQPILAEATMAARVAGAADHDAGEGAGEGEGEAGAADRDPRATDRDATGATDRNATERDATGAEYVYPGRLPWPGSLPGSPQVAERLAQVRLQELTTPNQTGAGESDCNRLVPGQRFTLGGALPGERHPRSSLNQDYLLVAVSHHGSQPQALGEEGGGGGGGDGAVEYGNWFDVVPANVEFRPPRVTRRPIALGTQTATVVGPAHEEIYVDSFGRVKVHFHWDREGKLDERASCWIRVAQIWAGAGYGGLFIPRVGQEVLVSFLEGDPDRPLITGSVYNAVQSKAYNPQEHPTVSSVKARSSPASPASPASSGGQGSNELYFRDAKGDELFGLSATRNMRGEVGNNSATVIGSDSTEEVKHDDEQHVAHRWTLRAEELVLGGKSVTFRVGQSSITLAPGSVSLNSPAIHSASSLTTSINATHIHLNRDSEPLREAAPSGRAHCPYDSSCAKVHDCDLARRKRNLGNRDPKRDDEVRRDILNVVPHQWGTIPTIGKKVSELRGKLRDRANVTLTPAFTGYQKSGSQYSFSAISFPLAENPDAHLRNGPGKQVLAETLGVDPSSLRFRVDPDQQVLVVSTDSSPSSDPPSAPEPYLGRSDHLTHHNQDLQAWEQARAAGKIRKGATLLHLDAHSDFRTATPPISPHDAGIGNYVNAAISDGTVDEYYWVVPEQLPVRPGEKGSEVRQQSTRYDYDVFVTPDGALYFQNPPQGVSQTQLRRVKCHVATLDQLAKGGDLARLRQSDNVLLDVDYDYLSNSGYDTRGYANDPDRADLITSLEHVGDTLADLKPAYVTLARSPEYTSEDDQVTIDRYMRKWFPTNDIPEKIGAYRAGNENETDKRLVWALKHAAESDYTRFEPELHDALIRRGFSDLADEYVRYCEGRLCPLKWRADLDAAEKYLESREGDR